MERVLDQLPEPERRTFAAAIRLFAPNQKVWEFNKRQLEILKQPVVVARAWHNCNTAPSASATLTSGLESELNLCIRPKKDL